ncbi:MAG: MOSC domain-containing protein [Cellvibrionaceae bacterium]|nr:MOSC domain-containing protein [Cellvibrionaceae bacterium]
MHIHSINIAQTRELAAPDGAMKTGIVKTPIQGSVRVHRLGLEGDYIGNKTVHGGEDQAVYLYSLEDNEWWARKLGREITPGTFGENLTLADFDSRECRIGDQLHIGELILEISAPRTPCSTLAMRMGDSGFVKTFFQAQRPGAYARVIRESSITVGDTVSAQQTHHDYSKTLDVFIEWNKKNKSREVLLKALHSPVAKVHKGKLQQWLDALAHDE